MMKIIALLLFTSIVMMTRTANDLHIGEYYPGTYILDHFWHDMTKH